MSFANMHDLLRASGEGLSLQVFAGQCMKERVFAALDDCRAWHQRHCTLQAPLVLSTVLALSLYRSSSIAEVFNNILHAARGTHDVDLADVTPEAMYKARARLGPKPLYHIARGLGAEAAPPASFLGLIPCAIDGVRMRLQDTPENVAEFGRPKASRGETAFPQMAGVALVAADTHVVLDCLWGPGTMSENAAAEVLLESLNSDHVVFLDRRYTKVELWFKMMGRGVRFVHRLSASYNVKRTVQLGPGDWLVNVGRWVTVPRPEQLTKSQKRQWMRRRWESRTLRVIEYQIDRGEIVQLLTDLVDPEAYPAITIARGYHLRWEIELSYDEIKTHLSTVQHGSLHTTFRSKTPRGVYQEAWATIACYNLVRGLMVEAGAKHAVAPLTISFVQTLGVIRRHVALLESCRGHRQRQLYNRMLREVSSSLIDRPRRKRTSPRVVKQKMSNFKLKQRHHKSVQHDFAAGLKLVDSKAA